ncbi:hypothetical protein MNB_SM-4-1162 [hydrothermal vent metagenome]|uniref:Uncharacterized protein n=1 Tax=hydrothermal vent metagenome TaxID=652676 RepID=A0A1W1CFF4_9ZZZZ
MQTQIEKLKEQLDLEFKEHSNDYYTNNFEDNEEYQLQIKDYDDYINSVDIDQIDIKWLVDLSNLHQEYSIFKNEKGQKKEALKHLSISTQYGYLALEYGSKACGCFKDKNPFIIQNKAVFLMSNILLTSNIEEFETVANHLIDSLNGKSCIIKKGYKQSSISWMILQMTSMYLNKPIKLHKSLQAKLELPLKDIVQHFETDDIIQVERLIYLMCDMHIYISNQSYEVHYEKQYAEDGDILGLKYKELFIVGLYQLPFEVLVWLKLRELKGLKNPKEFTHPLMSTNIVKMYLDIKEPLQKPEMLSYVKALIQKIKENCPEFKEQQIQDQAKENLTPLTQEKIAPKTGKYQAILPSGHPQEQDIKLNPFAFHRYNKDDSYIYEDLEEYPLELISWVYLGE